jgi:hypothetical protein
MAIGDSTAADNHEPLGAASSDGQDHWLCRRVSDNADKAALDSKPGSVSQVRHACGRVVSHGSDWLGGLRLAAGGRAGGEFQIWPARSDQDRRQRHALRQPAPSEPTPRHVSQR